MPEKYFTPTDLPNLAIDNEGVYAIAAHQPNPQLQQVGETADTTPVWLHAVAASEQVTAAIELRKFPLVRGVGMLATRRALEDTLPITFAGYLTDLRTTNRGMMLPCIVSAEQPEVPPDYVRLPHLVAYTPDENTIKDKSMWELLHGTEAEQWLGTSLPDQQFVEQHLPQLFKLRAAYRAHQLPDTRYYQELTRLLDKGRYLSILFVYQHFPLFEALLQE